MTPALRRFTFTTHITSSVGWVGAALAFLALAVIGFTTDDEVKVRGAYLLMAPAAWFILVPLAHAQRHRLVTGHLVGAVSALLGGVEVGYHGLRDRDLVDLHGDVQADGRRGRRSSDGSRGCAERITNRPRRPCLGAVAGRHSTGCL